MPDILHKVGIKSTSPGDVYNALATIDGLSGWWTTDTRGESKVGGELKFRFGDGGFDMKVLELEPGKRVAWQVADGPEEWLGTKISFDLKQNGDWTVVLFKHQGWKVPGRVHAPLQHQMGGLPAEPEIAPRNRQRGAVAERDQAR
jgi:uncharacterized protein YndB with AHSA1/START domain